MPSGKEALISFIDSRTSLGDLHRIRTGQQTDVHHGRIAAVQPALGVVALCFERYAGHVLEADYRTVRVGAYDDVLELLHGREPALRGDGDGNIHTFDGLLAEHAGGRFAVLVLQCALQVLNGYTETGQLVSGCTQICMA